MGVAEKRTILIVDDDPGCLEAVALTLSLEGYLVLQARDGLEALRQLEKATPALVLLDLQMPRVDGWTLLAQLRSLEHLDAVPVVGLSGSAFGLAGQDQFDAYLSKPFDGDQLVRTIRRLLPVSVGVG